MTTPTALQAPDLSLFDLTGRSALVTGGAVGAGRACATALARAGANVAILDVNREVGTKASAFLAALGFKVTFLRCDITDEEQVSESIHSVVRLFGRLDIAVNNAGTATTGTPSAESRGEWHRVMAVNLTGTWLCAQAQARQMAKQGPPGGKIINIASMWGSVAGSDDAYSASKAGVIHLSKALAVQWGGYNINVNCISPSWMMTPLMLTAVQAPEEFRRRAREITPLGHVQRPEDLYGAVIFLASTASDYVTGLDLIVDGGHTLNTWYSPMERKTSPRISPQQEVAHLKVDLGALGVPYPETDA